MPGWVNNRRVLWPRAVVLFGKQIIAIVALIQRIVIIKKVTDRGVSTKSTEPYTVGWGLSGIDD